MNGIYQNTVYGLAAKLPFKYTGAVVLGSVSTSTFPHPTYEGHPKSGGNAFVLALLMKLNLQVICQIQALTLFFDKSPKKYDVITKKTWFWIFTEEVSDVRGR